METRKLRVKEVISPGTVMADDGELYVLKGIPDTQEDLGDFVAAKVVVEKALLDTDILYDAASARELPDLPGMEIEVLAADSLPLTSQLAARVAGALVNHPME